MKICVQWTHDNPKGWKDITSDTWESLPFKEDPTSFLDIKIDGKTPTPKELREDQGGVGSRQAIFTQNAPINDTDGWIWKLNVNGIEFTADHIAVEDIQETHDGELLTGVKVWEINDSPHFYGDNMFHARVWRIFPLNLPGHDSKKPNKINTRQIRTDYGQQGYLDLMNNRVGPNSPIPQGMTTSWGKKVEFFPWDDLVLPLNTKIRHGITVPKLLCDQHEAAHDTRTWMESIDGIPPKYLEINAAGRQQVKT